MLEHLHHHDRNDTVPTNVAFWDREERAGAGEGGSGAGTGPVDEGAVVGAPDFGVVVEGDEGGFTGGGDVETLGVPRWVGDAVLVNPEVCEVGGASEREG